MKLTRILVASPILIFCGSGALAAQDSSAPQPVSIEGCPVLGVEPKCMMLTDHGVTCDITAAKEKPRVDYLGVRLKGMTDPGAVGYCMQGTILKDITWEYTRQKCPAPK